MKQLKIIVALVAGLFAFTSAQAGELSVTGSMQATYQSETDDVTGNPLGMNTDMTFSGSTDTDFGTATWSMATDGAFLGGADGNSGGNDHKMTLATSLGTFGLGNTGDAANAVDDITPSAFEEANGSGSGSYNDIGTLAGQMGIGTKFDVPVLGAVDFKYYPKADGTKNADNASSADTNSAVGSGSSLSIKTNLGDVPVVGSFLDGFTLTTGASEHDENTTANTDDAFEATVALTGSLGGFKLGYQEKYRNNGQTTEAEQHVFYRDTVYGLAAGIWTKDTQTFAKMKVKTKKKVHLNHKLGMWD